MEDNGSDISLENAASFPPLATGSLPELMEITDQQALSYVSQLLQRLIDIHREKFEMNGERRPSFESALEKSDGVVQKLVPARNFAVSADNSGTTEGNEPAFEPTLEYENAVELYKRFWLKEIPPISMPDYLQRFHRYCRSSAATYLTTGWLIYLVAVERHIIPVTQLNVYRLFCAAFMVAVKFIEDTMYPMSRYATTAGLKKADLARLEVSFLLLANFDVKVDRETLKAGLKSWAELNATCDREIDSTSELHAATVSAA